jgi:chromosome segregation ATPase
MKDQPTDAAERDPFARILAAVGMEDTTIWSDVADAVEALADQLMEARAEARVASDAAGKAESKLEELRLQYDELRAERDALRAKVEAAREQPTATHIYCDACGETRPLIAEPLTKDELNAEPWGDLVCGHCHFVIATVSVRDAAAKLAPETEKVENPNG